MVGGGFYSGFAPLPISAAWELFGEGNGVDSLAEMRARVGKYRRQLIAAGEDPEIGCVFIRDTVFFPPDAIVDPPPQFSPNIVQGKSYDLADPAVSAYFEDLLARLLGHPAGIDLAQPWQRPGPVYGDPRLVPSCRAQRLSPPMRDQRREIPTPAPLERHRRSPPPPAPLRASSSHHERRWYSDGSTRTGDTTAATPPRGKRHSKHHRFTQLPRSGCTGRSSSMIVIVTA